jgi:hypothetical protein
VSEVREDLRVVADVEASDDATDKDSPQSEARLSYEQRVERACMLLLQNSGNRPILYRILKICQPQRMRLHELEEQIQQRPEFTGVVQPPYFLIQWLVNVDALDSFDLDEEGNDLSPERLEGLTADEADDLIADTAFRTSDIGLEVIEEFSPQSRLIEVMNVVPERYDTYIEVLEFLTEKRSLAEIYELLRGRDVLMSGREAGENPLQPSVFVDKLASGGGIIYDDGWRITPEGKELLEAIKDKR